MNEMFVYRNWYIVIISHDHDNSYNDGFVINIPKVIIADISNSITVTYLFYFHSFCDSFLTGEITKTEQCRRQPLQISAPPTLTIFRWH